MELTAPTHVQHALNLSRGTATPNQNVEALALNGAQITALTHVQLAQTLSLGIANPKQNARLKKEIGAEAGAQQTNARNATLQTSGSVMPKILALLQVEIGANQHIQVISEDQKLLDGVINMNVQPAKKEEHIIVMIKVPVMKQEEIGVQENGVQIINAQRFAEMKSMPSRGSDVALFVWCWRGKSRTKRALSLVHHHAWPYPTSHTTLVLSLRNRGA